MDSQHTELAESGPRQEREKGRRRVCPARLLPGRSIGAALLLGCLCFFGAPASAWASGEGGPQALRVGVLEDADNPAQTAVREAFLETLVRMAGAEAAGLGAADSGAADSESRAEPLPALVVPPVVVPEGALCRVKAEEAAKAAESLARREDLDLILVSGYGNLRQLLAVGTGSALALALTPDCAEAAEATNVRAFPGELLLHRLRALHQVAGFKRLGIMVGGKELPGARAMHTLLALAETAGETLPFAVYSFADMPDSSTQSCREAIDSLYFDAIDALLFDGSACFEGKRGDLQEHLELLGAWGVLPLSLLDAEAAHNGALLAPWTGETARLGRDLALGWLFSTPQGRLGTKLAVLYPYIHKPVTPFTGAAPGYALRLDVAEGMGFDPSPTLLILTREVVEEDLQGARQSE
jgi:hypothetical protein